MAPERLRILLIDGDATFLDEASKEFVAERHRVVATDSAAQAFSSLERTAFDVIVIGSRLSDGTGLDLLKRLRRTENSSTIVFVAEDNAVELVIEAFRAGASDCLIRPNTPQELECRCRQAHEGARRFLRGCVSAIGDNHRVGPEMIGASPAIVRLRRLIDRVGPSDQSVLIEGESGTGKELVARALLRASGRAHGPFVTVNCAALPESLLESEFFGPEKGAFTGATATKTGLFEEADGGTLFVDEIGELAPALQAKLLRVLEDGSFRRVGSVKERTVDVRVIAATNRDLAQSSAAGKFREDLYYRINVLSLKVPPLRERVSDIPLLVDAFLGSGWMLEPGAKHAVEHYSWPGNVRQLKNTIERAKVLADSAVIRLCDLPVEVALIAEIDPRPAPPVMVDDMRIFSREHVLNVLAREGGNKSHAARALGIHRRTLYRMLERWSAAEDRGPVNAISPVGNV
jgi:DNA-binding NtrC family response regulator